MKNENKAAILSICRKNNFSLNSAMYVSTICSALHTPNRIVFLPLHKRLYNSIFHR